MSISVPTAEPLSAEGYEPVSQFGATLIDLLWPWMTLHLAWVLDAIGVVVDPIYTLVQDVGDDDGVTPTVGTYFNGELVTDGFQPGYGALLNPQACTAGNLPFLAQFPGVQLPLDINEAGARSLIIAEGGLNRGTPAAVIAAAKRFLSGTQSAVLRERTYSDGTPYAGWFVLIVRPEEIIDLAGLIAAVNAVKLSGLRWTLIQSDAPLVEQYTRTFAGITVELSAATIADVT